MVAAPRRLGAASVVSGGTARPLHEVETKSISTEASRCSVRVMGLGVKGWG